MRRALSFSAFEYWSFQSRNHQISRVTNQARHDTTRTSDKLYRTFAQQKFVLARMEGYATKQTQGRGGLRTRPAKAFDEQLPKS